MLKEKIIAEALRLGFSFIGFSKPWQTPHFPQFESWIKAGNHDGLDYLGKKYVLDARNQPAILLNNAGTVITLGISYQKPAGLEDYRNPNDKRYGLLAGYACLPDYHRLMKEKSKELIGFLSLTQNSPVKTKFFVDSGPVMEKDFAYLSGLGWIGKNSLFFSPGYGSFCLLGCLFADIELPADKPDDTDLCGNCEQCIQACPTGAINNNRTINTSQCISYLTTSHKGVFPFELRHQVGNKVFGCDVCQNVCPLNSDLPKSNYQNIGIKPILKNKINLLYELSFSEKEYIAKYSKTPVAKLPYELFLRNLIIAIGNSCAGVFFDPLSKLILCHPSPVIRGTSAWALAAIALDRSKDLLINAMKQETEVEVRNEIESLLGYSR